METKKSSILFTVNLIVIGMALVGCVSSRVNLVDENIVAVERVDSEMNCIYSPHVFQNGDQLVISGRVKCPNFRGFNGGHIDIAILNGEGEILESLSTFHYPRNIPRKGGRESRFHINLPLTPPEGTVVRLAFHKTRICPDGAFQCDDNAAITCR